MLRRQTASKHQDTQSDGRTKQKPQTSGLRKNQRRDSPEGRRADRQGTASRRRQTGKARKETRGKQERVPVCNKPQQSPSKGSPSLYKGILKHLQYSLQIRVFKRLKAIYQTAQQKQLKGLARWALCKGLGSIPGQGTKIPHTVKQLERAQMLQLSPNTAK